MRAYVIYDNFFCLSYNVFTLELTFTFTLNGTGNQFRGFALNKLAPGTTRKLS